MSKAAKSNVAREEPRRIDPKVFLTDVATDPVKLGRFISDPSKMMDDAGIEHEHRVHIKNAIAHHVHECLASHPDQYFVLF